MEYLNCSIEWHFYLLMGDSSAIPNQGNTRDTSHNSMTHLHGRVPKSSSFVLSPSNCSTWRTMAGKDIVDGCQRPPLVGLPCIVLDQPLLHLTFALVAAATPSSPSCCYGYWSSPPSPLTSARCSLCNASSNEPQPQGPPQPATAASSVQPFAPSHSLPLSQEARAPSWARIQITYQCNPGDFSGFFQLLAHQMSPDRGIWSHLFFCCLYQSEDWGAPLYY